MLVMPANSTGWFWHCLARETGKIGHLYSPGAQCGPWPWFPFALDNGAFSCWDMQTNRFDDAKWKSEIEPKWLQLLRWAAPGEQARWAIVPDRPGCSETTLQLWGRHVQTVIDFGIPPAIAVQDGMTVEDVQRLRPAPVVVAVGGTTEWKWATVELWAKAFKRVHLLRCNMPDKLEYLQKLGVESCDGTGWNRGNRVQTQGLENWARKDPSPKIFAMSPYVSRAKHKEHQELFGV